MDFLTLYILFHPTAVLLQKPNQKKKGFPGGAALSKSAFSLKKCGHRPQLPLNHCKDCKKCHSARLPCWYPVCGNGSIIFGVGYVYDRWDCLSLPVRSGGQGKFPC